MFCHDSKSPFGWNLISKDDLSLYLIFFWCEKHACYAQPSINQIHISYITSQVSDVEARSTLIQLSPPDCELLELDINPLDFSFELLLSEKGRDAKYKSVFW